MGVPLLLPLAWGQDPALSVRVEVPAPLALVRLLDRKLGLDQLQLMGTAVAVVTNGGAAAARVQDLAEHGFVFTRSATGERHIMVHSCLCAEQAVHRADRVVDIPAGGSWTVAIDDWGCGGGPWAPPPEGAWNMSYRVLPAAPGLANDRRDVPELVTGCRTELMSEAFWTGAVSSPPVAVTLGKAKVRKP
jgi:hypothetical protein